MPPPDSLRLNLLPGPAFATNASITKSSGISAMSPPFSRCLAASSLVLMFLFPTGMPPHPGRPSRPTGPNRLSFVKALAPCESGARRFLGVRAEGALC